MISKRSKHATSFLLLAAAAFSQGGATDCGQIIEDPGFDLWCGAELCSWKLDRGDIRPAPTWHAADDGVDFLGDDTAISQLTEVTSSDGTCIRFEMVADVEETAEVTLEMDVFDDGVLDFSQQIPTSDWEVVSLRIRMPDSYQGVRFRLTKRGGGRAVLAQIEAAIADDCAGEPIVIDGRPEGAWCATDRDCLSGYCLPGFFTPSICQPCGELGDCGLDAVCSLAAPYEEGAEPTLICGDYGARGLGEQCFSGGECESGLCNLGVCSTCSVYRPCPAGQACEPAYGSDEAPTMCDPGQGRGAPGALCLGNADCASDRCDGAGPLQLCAGDGRRCTTDADCPPEGSPAPCETVGIDRGTCQ
jgi:hypothetical protein